jgi:hypothetical protein
MASSGMLRRVALVRTDVSEELIAFIIKVRKINTLQMVVNSNFVSSEVFKAATMKNAVFWNVTPISSQRP